MFRWLLAYIRDTFCGTSDIPRARHDALPGHRTAPRRTRIQECSYRSRCHPGLVDLNASGTDYEGERPTMLLGEMAAMTSEILYAFCIKAARLSRVERPGRHLS